jgi:predicted phage tail protein
MEQTLSDRYAPPPAWRRPVTIWACVVVAVVFLTWLAWAAFVQATPKVSSQLNGFEVVDGHRVHAQIAVRLESSAVRPRCSVQALASDHSVVGEQTFTPASGDNSVTVRTDRRATTVDLIGCTAAGQNEAR